MIVRTGDTARKLFREAQKNGQLKPDPKVYDYMVKNGAVLIRRLSHECLYIKTTGGRTGRAIALQGTPKEFAEHKNELEELYEEMEIVNWAEVEEMTAWAPNVPRL